jgi:hypothetical protein
VLPGKGLGQAGFEGHHVLGYDARDALGAGSSLDLRF